MDKIYPQPQELNFLESDGGEETSHQGFVAKLTQFEGPLDLLLHLIQKAKVSIQDIFVSQITEQYLAYMSQVDELDMSSASAFLSVAATLVEIKSRSLLPKPVEIEEGEEDPEQALIRQLEEYTLFKNASQNLKVLEIAQQDVYHKLPEEYLGEPREIILHGVSLEGLYAAFAALLAKQTLPTPRAPEHEVFLDAYSVTERALHIMKRLRSGGRVNFSELFEGQTTKDALVTTFLALLELIRQGRVSVTQSKMFDEIKIVLKKGRNHEAEPL